MSGNTDTASIHEAGGTERELIMQLANMFRATTIAGIPDPVDAMTYGAAAGTTFAGIIYGQMIAAGIESGSRQRTKLMLKTVEKQFKAGIEIGLRNASRVASEMGLRQ